jgi:hypothetical protein
LATLGLLVFNANLVAVICQKIADESDLTTVKDLNNLVLAIIKENHEEVRLRIAYLARAYGITFNESQGSRGCTTVRYW